MADRLNQAAKAYNKAWSAKDKADFSRVFDPNVPDPTPSASAPSVAEPSADEQVQKMQAANAADPSIQDKLNAVAKARAKFYGAGQ